MNIFKKILLPLLLVAVMAVNAFGQSRTLSTFNGNVGIGTTTPQFAFHVIGTSTFFGGNIGIGTTTPQTPFHVVGTTTFSGNLEFSDSTIQDSAAKDFSKENTAGVIFISGDETTEGSDKIIPSVTEAGLEFRNRENGVWNDAALLIKAGSLGIGRENVISSAGSYINPRDVSERTKGLVPRILFTTGSGTAAFATIPNLGPLITNVDIQPDLTSGSLKTSHTFVWTGAGDEFTFRMHVEVGTVSATSDVTMTLYRGSDDTGPIFFTQNYPASDFPSLTRVSKELGGLPETFAGEDIFIEYNSDIAFDLKGSSGGDMYVAHCYHDVTEESIVVNGSSPDFTTQSPSDNSTKAATTEYVESAVLVEDFWERAGTVISPKVEGDDIATGGIFDSNGYKFTLDTPTVNFNTLVSRGALPSTGTHNNFAYSPELGRLILIGTIELFYSDDFGATWIDVPAASAFGLLTGAAWSPALNLFAIVDNGQNIRTSPDGIVWTLRDSGGGFGKDMKWYPHLNLFVTPFSWSPDGITWTASTGSMTDYFKSVYMPSRGTIVAIKDGVPHTTHETTDGKSWSIISTITEIPGGLARGAIGYSETLDRLLVGVAFISGPTAYSDDGGVTWTASTDLGPVWGFEWSPDHNLFFSGGAVVESSPDGIAWTPLDSPIGGTKIPSLYDRTAKRWFLAQSTGTGYQATDKMILNLDGDIIQRDSTGNMKANPLVSLSDAGVFTGLVEINDGAVATTQSPSDNSTRIATTAYTDAQIATDALWDRAGTILGPKTAGDDIATTGGISGSAGTFTAGVNITGSSTTISSNGQTRFSATSTETVLKSETGADSLTLNTNDLVYHDGTITRLSIDTSATGLWHDNALNNITLSDGNFSHSDGTRERILSDTNDVTLTSPNGTNTFVLDNTKVVITRNLTVKNVSSSELATYDLARNDGTVTGSLFYDETLDRVRLDANTANLSIRNSAAGGSTQISATDGIVSLLSAANDVTITGTTGINFNTDDSINAVLNGRTIGTRGEDVFEIYSESDFGTAPGGILTMPSGKYILKNAVSLFAIDAFIAEAGAIIEWTSEDKTNHTLTSIASSKTLFDMSGAASFKIDHSALVLAGSNMKFLDNTGIGFNTDISDVSVTAIGATDTFFAGTGGNLTITNSSFVAVSGGKLFEHTGASLFDIWQFGSNTFVGWDLGSLNFMNVNFSNNVFINPIDTLTLNEVISFKALDFSFGFTTGAFNKPIFDFVNSQVALTANVGSVIKVHVVGGQFPGTGTLLRLGPKLNDNSLITVDNVSFVGGELFDVSGTNGTFESVADASVAAESITSVTDFSGVARFNYSAPPSLSVNQELIVSGFATNTAYNGIWLATGTGTGYFEVATVAFGSDEMGTFTSNSVMLTGTFTALSDGDGATLDTVLSTDYDGGCIVYNKQANSIQVNRTWTETKDGTWSNEGIDFSDPRVLALNNARFEKSKAIFYGHVEKNQTNTTIAVTDLYQDIKITGEIGSITVFADGGTSTTTVTSAAHGLVENQNIQISGTINYNGQFRIFNISASTFDIISDFMADDAVGEWETGFLISDSNQRFKVVNKVNAEIEYTGNEPFNGIIDLSFSVLKTGNAEKYIFSACKNNTPPIHIPFKERTVTTSSGSLNVPIPITLIKGETIKPQLAGVLNTDTLTVQGLLFSARE